MTAAGNEDHQEVEAGEARAAPAQRTDSEAMRARAAVREMLSPQELDSRQEAMGEKRRRGGPQVDEMEDAADEEDAPDVPETEAAE